jgi:hypothetical protein
VAAAAGSGSASADDASGSNDNNLSVQALEAAARATNPVVIAICSLLAAAGIAAVAAHQRLPRKALTKVDAFASAHPVGENESPVSYHTALGGAYTVLVVCLALCLAISMGAQPNEFSSSSLSPLVPGDEAQSTITIAVTTLGSNDCTQHISGIAAVNAAATPAAGADAATCSFELVCADCSVEGRRTLGFDAHWSVQQGVSRYPRVTAPGASLIANHPLPSTRFLRSRSIVHGPHIHRASWACRRHAAGCHRRARGQAALGRQRRHSARALLAHARILSRRPCERRQLCTLRQLLRGAALEHLLR